MHFDREANAELEKIKANLKEEISKRLKAEEEIKRLNEALGTMVIERTNQLQVLNTILEEKIVEKIQAENELRNERVFTDASFNSAPGMIYLYDDKGKLVRWNKPHEEMTGYTSEELANMNLLDWYEGDETCQTAVLEGIERVNQNGFGDAEANLQRKDGTKIPMYFTASSVTIDGKLYFAGIGIDITERKMLHEKLEKEYFYKYNLEHLVKERTSELSEANNSLELLISEKERMQTEKIEQLRKYLTLESELSCSNEVIADIIKNMPDGFYVLDHQWRFMFVNKKTEKFLLKTREDILGQVFWDIFPKVRGTLLELNYQKARNDNEAITFDFASSSQGGTWYQITVFPCQFGLSVYFKNITEQKKKIKRISRRDCFHS